MDSSAWTMLSPEIFALLISKLGFQKVNRGH